MCPKSLACYKKWEIPPSKDIRAIKFQDQTSIPGIDQLLKLIQFDNLKPRKLCTSTFMQHEFQKDTPMVHGLFKITQD
jgi:hypothetical protein